MNNYQFNNSQYLKKINNKKIFPIIFLVLIIIITLGFCLLFKSSNTNKIELYFIQLNEFPTYNSASKFAQDVKNNGGAGYIYFDKNYRVFAGLYKSKEDAEKVLKNIQNDYNSSKIYSLSFPYLGKIEKENRYIKSYKTSVLKTIFHLEKLCCNFFKNEIHFNELEIHIENTQKSFNISNNDLMKYLGNSPKTNSIKQYMVSIQDSIYKLSKYNELEIIENFRYEIINIAINYFQFLSCF